MIIRLWMVVFTTIIALDVAVAIGSLLHLP